MKRKIKIGAAVAVSIATMVTLVPNGFAQSSVPYTEETTLYTGMPMNPFNNNYSQPPGMVLSPLAWSKNTANVNDFWPGLAQKWSLSTNGQTLTVWLRKDAKWSDGSPVTATDVKFSFAAWAALGKDGYELTGIKIVNDHELVFQRSVAPYNLFENQILQQAPVPSKVYAKFLPANVWTLIAQSQYVGPDKAKQKSAADASNQLASMAKKLQAYNPPSKLGYLSDGPFVITGYNSGQVSATKNQMFWGAKEIQVQNVQLINVTTNQEVWSNWMAAKFSSGTAAAPTNVVQAASKVPGNKFFTVPEYAFSGVLFNQRTYPYNMVQVRQAMAYIIDRQTVAKVENPFMGPNDLPGINGMGNTVLKAVLSAKQIGQLNAYNYNATAGEKLLTSVGFKKGSDGKWLMPNGKPWKITLYAPNGLTDWIQGGTYMANTLTSLGIPTTMDTVDPTAYNTEQVAGKYAVSFAWFNGGQTPAQAYQSIYGADDGFTLVNGALKHTNSALKGNYVQSPTAIQVKGVGAIQPGAITVALGESNSAYEIQQGAFKLAMAVNQTVPFIPTEPEMATGFINTKHFTDFPVNQPAIMGAQPYEGFILWMELGYIKPVK